MKAAILSVGNEIIEGYVTNTNATYFSSKLNEIGVDVIKHLTVLDKRNDIIKAIEYLNKDHDLIVVSGGLGPTGDDITKESIAQALGLKLELNDNELNKIKEHFKQHKIKYHDTNRRQALFSSIDTILINHNGTANGYYFTKDQVKYCVLPGPPSENHVMFDEYIKTLVKSEIYELDLYATELGESTSEQMIKDVYIKYPEVYIGTYMQDYGINLRIRSANKEKIIACKNELISILGDYYLIDSKDPVQSFVQLLINQQITISFAESCTAGLACSLIDQIPGVSAVLKESHITYSNESKEKYLNVSKTILKEHGAVSAQCASAMASGLKELSNSRLNIAITGIAGPSGGTLEKPVGTVYFNINFDGKEYSYHKVFRGDRNQVRIRAAKFIIFEALRIVNNG